ncbi:MAG: hypothetical protein J7M40_19105 [Planctomycetes bacterium]|nr:hypothetical protein [Planctomycetota bacterium]
MVFRFYSDQLSQATKGVAAWIFMAGLFLVGFGLLVILLQDVFVFIAAGMFFLFGFCVMFYAVRLYLAARRMGKNVPDEQTEAYRENVKVRIENREV